MFTLVFLLHGCKGGEVTINPALRTDPKLIETARPTITPEMADKLPGVVFLEITVDETGQVIDAVVIGSTDPLFESEAVKTAMRYRYEPSTSRGTIIKISKPVGISFEDPEAKANPPAVAVPGMLPLAKIGETSPGNPYVGDKFSISGGIKGDSVNFVAKHESDNYLSELTITDRNRYLRMSNWQGKIVFDGYVDTPKQRKTLNQDQRYILERLNQAVVLNNNTN